ncbi:hypothetical protein MKZ38_009401 [Zalerion maritima]|uniref:DUF676 domain-containing protein n=1 Tax=Zalerion maritima TaxID=339359 RepID=A0AAD5RV33_9PEZI|nr:hypothetical protein MKZ38_009401 [Zalerion maritima]
MLLLHQIGSVKVGEVIRYTVTYTPSNDRILPSPEFLFLRVRNTSTIALRAAFVHGPYTISVAAYPASFNPNEKFTQAATHGVPEFEPMLKAGGYWGCHLVVPDEIRQSAGTGGGHFGGYDMHADNAQDAQGVSWVIEVSSQVIFSASAAVGYEILLGRDEKSLNNGPGLSLPLGSSNSQAPQPGKISDHQQSIGAKDGTHVAQPKGVFSRAVSVRVDDTASLWNTPRLPEWDEVGKEKPSAKGNHVSIEETEDSPEAVGKAKGQEEPPRKPKKVHLVVLTHGLHSNLGTDMLFLKESIDAATRKAKEDAKERKAKERGARQGNHDPKTPYIHLPLSHEGDDDEDEEVIVRGFSGNATRTERGIKYLGKRLARYILTMTYPDQPYLPVPKAASDTVGQVFKSSESSKDSTQIHKGSCIHRQHSPGECLQENSRPYRITSISFVAHSLGGLVQTYAVAYMQKHSPQVFDVIRPINFITLASPFLGLSNENPLYVKFALDFGLVGRTGQDLGLTWRAPTIARSGWGAIVGNLGETAHKKVLGEPQPESKPLLRILPTGPAHTALQKFRNRTVYSNVVNDGIVPLRTSCLLFLDWQGLGRVDKARREAGLVETVVGFGWAELTGANVTSPRNGRWQPTIKDKDAKDQEDSSDNTPGAVTPSGHDHSHDVPLPPSNATLDEDRVSLRSFTNTPYQGRHSGPNEGGPLSGFLSLFQKDNGSHNNGNGNANGPKSPTIPKANKIYRRSQTLKMENDASGGKEATNSATLSQTRVTAGNEYADEIEGLSAPPRTTFFESAGDLLNPKLPSVEYLIDPTKRPRTIFHDRVYHPTDIPPPPLKKRPTSSLGLGRRSFSRTVSGSSNANKNGGDSTKTAPSSRASSPFKPPQHEDSWTDYYDPNENNGSPSEAQALAADIVDSANMKVEEKIARAYHRGLSWRKVLVKLEPDAHNNIMVRRMFANAFGWPVVKHMVDAHFSDEVVARMRDEDEVSAERARSLARGPGEDGKETRLTGDEERDLKLSERVSGSQSESRDGENADQAGEGDRRRDVEEKEIETVHRTDSERGEAEDSVGALRSAGRNAPSPGLHSHGPGLSIWPGNSGSGSKQLQQERGGSKAGGSSGGPGLKISPGGYVPPPSVLTSPVTTMLSGTGSRPVFRDRYDNASWSERDWADSGDDTDDAGDFMGGTASGCGEKTPTTTGSGDVTSHMSTKSEGKSAAAREEGSQDGSLAVGKDPVKGAGSSPLGSSGLSGGWNWTEKVVGKKYAAKSPPPASPTVAEAPGAAGSSHGSPTGQIGQRKQHHPKDKDV